MKICVVITAELKSECEILHNSHKLGPRRQILLYGNLACRITELCIIHVPCVQVMHYNN